MRVLTRDEHDHVVRHYAFKMLADGYEIVGARVDGWFDEPQVIAGYRPDIIARSPDERYVIVEIEKGDMDYPKILALKHFSAENHKYDVKVIHADEIDPRI